MEEEIKIDEEELKKLDKKLTRGEKSKITRKIRKDKSWRCKVYLKRMKFDQNNLTLSQKEYIADYYGFTLSQLNKLL